MSDLFVEELGAGDRVVLVHGSGPREATWSDQRPLAERFRLVIPDRRGYGRSPSADPSFEFDAEDIAALLGNGAHLVGSSYGGLSALLAAARRPRAVRSLVVSEPVAFAIARGTPAVDELVARMEQVYAAGPMLTPEEFDARLDTALGFPSESVKRLEPVLRAAVQSIMRERPPWQATIPVDELAALRCPKVVVSGDWSPAFDAVCDALATAIGAERHVEVGFGRHAVPHAPGFNSLLERVWLSAVS